MTFGFRPAKRENVPLLIGLAGGTGSGKTYSAMLIAKGLAAGKPFAVIDTEAGRAQHYADIFTFDHGDLQPPFRPDAYAEAIAAADAAGYPVIVVDSASHEHAGEGGLLDMHAAELDRMAGTDWAKRERVKMTAWIAPKGEHKRFVSKLLQLRAHLILCFRAEEKLEQITGEDGKKKWVPKRSLTGLGGWMPISEKSLPYELTASFLLTADAPGLPKPIKLQEQHKPFFPLDQPISEAAGTALADWARGAETSPAQGPRDERSNTVMAQADTGGASEWADESEVTAVFELAARVGQDEHDKTVAAVAKHREKYDDKVSRVWLGKLSTALLKKAPAEEPREESLFKPPAGVGA